MAAGYVVSIGVMMMTEQVDTYEQVKVWIWPLFSSWLTYLLD
jgi:hypothetical protein